MVSSLRNVTASRPCLKPFTRLLQNMKESQQTESSRLQHMMGWHRWRRKLQALFLEMEADVKTVFHTINTVSLIKFCAMENCLFANQVQIAPFTSCHNHAEVVFISPTKRSDFCSDPWSVLYRIPLVLCKQHPYPIWKLRRDDSYPV